MRTNLFLIALAATAASPALAQDPAAEGTTFNGVYVGGSFGGAFQPNDGGSTVRFDRDLNGSFGDTITNVAGANAFSTGFCGGAATSSGNNTCTNDKDGIEYAGRIGFDLQASRFVFGVVGEFGKPEIRDSVSAFSTTPASYTLTRSVRYNAAIRARVGFTPNDTTLFYATGGGAYGRIRNSFSSSNVANTFTTNGSQDAYGYSVGGGVEQRFGRNFSVGLEYIHTSLKDDNARVRVGQGTAAATSPFLLGGAGGTDFRRSDEKFRWNSIRATAQFRF